MARRSLHAVAELVLAEPQYRATGKLRLRVVPGGFATILDTRVAGRRHRGRRGRGRGCTDLRPHRSRHRRRARADGGAGPGCLQRRRRWLPTWYETLDARPRPGRHDHGRARPRSRRADRRRSSEPSGLWPEHFDVAISVREATFGVSPGDGFIEEPYAYVGVTPAACR